MFASKFSIIKQEQNSLGFLYTGLKNGSIIEFDPLTRKTRVVYSSLSVDDHLLTCGNQS